MQLFPLVAIFIIGVVLRLMGVATEKHSSLLLRLVFYFGLPIVIFLAIVKVQLNESLLSFALLPLVIMSVTLVSVLVLKRSLLQKIKPKELATLLAGAAILNLSFMYPFVATSYGADGLARLAVIDCFNAIMIFSFLYAIIAGMAQHRARVSKTITRVLAAPTLWALIAGLLFKLSGSALPHVAITIFEPAALLVSWTLIFALGIKFKWHLKNPRLFVVQFLLRFILGAIVGICFVKLFHLHGLDAEIVLVASVAPIGLNSITLAEIEKLDVDFAVSSVSASLIIGIVTVPFIIHFIHSIAW